MSAIIFEWFFPKLAVSDTDEHQNVVVIVDWALTGTDGTNQKKLDGAFSIELNSEVNFIEFDALTKEHIESWALSNLPVDSLKDEITRAVTEMTAPSFRFVTPPWE